MAHYGGFISFFCRNNIYPCQMRNQENRFRRSYVLMFAWIMVFIVGSYRTISTLTAKSLLFFTLSGMATGGSWICYFKALSLGDVNKVVPIDKSSTILSILFAIILFGETENLAG